MSEPATRVLIPADRIHARIQELARDLEADLAGREPILVVILRGAVVFAADLMRAMSLPVHLDFMAVASYGASTRSSGVVRIVQDLDEDIHGQDVVIVEDIVDTGLTLKYLQETLRRRHPHSLTTAVLLDKRARRTVDVPVEHIGFEIPDLFVVGFGLDYAGRHRNYPDVRVLDPEA